MKPIDCVVTPAAASVVRPSVSTRRSARKVPRPVRRDDPQTLARTTSMLSKLKECPAFAIECPPCSPWRCPRTGSGTRNGHAPHPRLSVPDSTPTICQPLETHVL